MPPTTKPRTPAPPKEFSTFIAAYPEPVQALALRARESLLSRRADLVEKVWPGWKAAGYGIGPKMGDVVAALGPAKAHLGLHLMGGPQLPDPDGLLQGVGKGARHVRLTSVEMLESAPVQRLIDAAFELADSRSAGLAPSAKAATSHPVGDDAVAAKTGPRDVHQTPAGYQVGGSKTIGVALDQLWKAWADARTRKRWLTEPFTTRKATEPKSMRITWHDGTDLQVLFYAKGEGKSQVTVDHRKLPPSQVASMKTFWRERLEALKALLESKS